MNGVFVLLVRSMFHFLLSKYIESCHSIKKILQIVSTNPSKMALNDILNEYVYRCIIIE